MGAATQFEVKGLARDKLYRVTVKVHNGFGWSAASPVTTINIQDHVPVPPCAPLLESIAGPDREERAT
jgi:hypothetical protein